MQQKPKGRITFLLLTLKNIGLQALRIRTPVKTPDAVSD